MSLGNVSLAGFKLTFPLPSLSKVKLNTQVIYSEIIDDFDHYLVL